MSDDKKKTPDGRPKSGTGKKPTKSTKSQTSKLDGDEPAFNTVLGAEEPQKSAQKGNSSKRSHGVSRSSALMMSVLAALAGGAIGWGGPVFFGGQSAKNAALQSSLDQARSDLDLATTERKKLADSLAAIQGTSRNQASSNQSLSASLGALEDQVQELKNAEPVDNSEALAALEERISKLGTVTIPDGEEGTASVDLLALVERVDTIETGGSEEIATRLAELETRIEDISTRPSAFPKPDPTPAELPTVETVQSAEEALNILIDTFPRAKMLEAIDAQKVRAAEKPSWIQRALSRHVKTHDEGKADPIEIVDAAEAALKQGQVSNALKLMGDLNPPVRVIAADWMGAAKKAAKRIEKDL